MQKIAKDLYVENTFTGVTVGALITTEGIVCIDTPTFPSDARRWQQRLAEISSQPVRYLINLDHRRDRVLGNQWFDAPAIAHELTYERVRLLPEMFKSGQPEAGADVELAPDLQGVRVVPPQITFANRLTLMCGGREVQISHHPGAAPGAAWVEFPKEQVVFVGDTLTNGVPPLLPGADMEQWLEALAQLRKSRWPARTIIPGRGPLADKNTLKAMEDFLKAVRRKVETLARAKKPRAEATAAAEGFLETFKVPPALREHYTRRLRAGLEYLYDTFTAAPASH